MWIALAQYVALVDKAARAETRADWLLTRVNQLELEAGDLRFQLTGRPQPVPMFQKAATPRPEAPPQVGESFEDMGDDEAVKHGIGWDEHGRVTLPA